MLINYIFEYIALVSRKTRNYKMYHHFDEVCTMCTIT